MYNIPGSNSKFQPLTLITKHSILDVTAALDPPLRINPRNPLE